MDEHDQTPQLGSYMDGLPHPKAIPGWVWFRDFDWPALYERLGEAEPRDAAADVRQVQADYLREILVGLVAPHRGKSDLHAVGLRCVGLAVALGMKSELPRGVFRTYSQRLHSARWRERRKRKA